MRGNPTQKNAMQCNAAWCCVAKTEDSRHKGDFLTIYVINEIAIILALLQY